MIHISELSPQYCNLLFNIDPSDIVVAGGGTLSQLVGRNNRRGNNKNTKWRTVIPFITSFCIWLLTGESYAPGNPHVKNWDHSDTSNYPLDNINLTKDDKTKINKTVTSLFTWAEAQNDGTSFRHTFTVINPRSRTGYVFQVRCEYDTATGERINVSVKKFQNMPQVQLPNVQAVTTALRGLGF